MILTCCDSKASSAQPAFHLEGGDLGPIRIPSQAVYHDPAADAEEESLENVNKFFRFDSGDVVSGSEEGRRLQGVYKERRRGIKGSNW